MDVGREQDDGDAGPHLQASSQSLINMHAIHGSRHSWISASVQQQGAISGFSSALPLTVLVKAWNRLQCKVFVYARHITKRIFWFGCGRLNNCNK